jgi:hypothetical protein
VRRDFRVLPVLLEKQVYKAHRDLTVLLVLRVIPDFKALLDRRGTPGLVDRQDFKVRRELKVRQEYKDKRVSRALLEFKDQQEFADNLEQLEFRE